MLLTALPPRRLGVGEDRARLRFGRADPATAFSARRLFLDGEAAFELSLWCGTCPFLFERQEGARGTLSADVGALAELERGLTTIDERVLGAVAPLLPDGDYLPLLLEVRPELVAPHNERDYFTHEQVATWGVDSFWGLPEYPRTPYYRTFETSVSHDGHLYEFVVPMVPPGWNDAGRVQHYRDLMSSGTTPAAVALSTLDVCQPAVDDESVDYHAHWGLTHFLLDGHHRLQAAAAQGASVRLLALVSAGASLAGPADLDRLPAVRAQRSGRRAGPRGGRP